MNPINLERFNFTINNSLGYNFFAVCDGHGVNGHIVSGYIKNNLSSIFYIYNIRTPHKIHKR